jgi:2-keto-4-pentenoate hydratase/2-oxohepta-3-ene-1,7-dioic acid hydratase in catechol pathway
MRLVSYGPTESLRAGVLVDGEIIDLEDGMRAAGVGAPVTDMTAFLSQDGWRGVLDRIARSGGRRVDPSGVRIGPPVPNPRKLMLAGVNTFSHLTEVLPLLGKVTPPRKPVILSKATSSISGPNDAIVLPPETRKLDYEVELGIVIGRRGRRIKESEVRDHVAGFMTLNDVSARDVQLAEHEENKFYRVHYLGKSFDTFCPTGPALVTVDEFEWGRPLRMRAFVNGEIRQDSDTSDLCHGISALVVGCSEAMTLYPGDIITSGSPAGVALFREPQQFLRAGDVVRCEIDGVGAIENRVTAESARS